MASARNADQKKLISLEQAARQLGVSVETLLSWNEHHILKPTITQAGEIGYDEEQLEFLQKFLPPPPPTEQTPPQDPSQETLTENHQTEAETSVSSKSNLYQKFVNHVGDGFYEDEYVK